MDKVLHFGVCFLVNMVISFAMPSQAVTGVGLSVGLSLGKEYGDSQSEDNYFSNYDLLSDGLGISLGVGLGLYVNDLLLDGEDLF